MGIVPEQGWNEIAAAGRLRFRSPVELKPMDARGIDSNVTIWQGRNLTVMLDEGPYADPLQSYSHRPDARSSEETISGRPARVVAFRLEDGSDFAAAHFKVAADDGRRTLTISVTGREELGGEVPLRILRSVELIGP